jgi:Ser/Thr protein kinase RdoA (MazF antagonist)
MIDDTAIRAAALWGIPSQDLMLAARRENTVLRAHKNGRDYALRLHRPGYRTRTQLLSELQWMEALALNGLAVPLPETSQNGALVEYLGTTPVSMLSWMPGAPSGVTGQLNVADPQKFARALGHCLARLHEISDAWTPPDAFSRPAWDLEGLLGEEPLWGPFWENPDLSPDEKLLLQRVRDKAHTQLSSIAQDLDYGLIHADVITENILVHENAVGLIDFDDGGSGFRAFELATFLMRFLDHPDYPVLRRALLAGYGDRAWLTPDILEFFILLRALTYPGWIIPRRDEPGGKARSQKAVQTAVPLARSYLNA